MFLHIKRKEGLMKMDNNGHLYATNKGIRVWQAYLAVKDNGSMFPGILPGIGLLSCLFKTRHLSVPASLQIAHLAIQNHPHEYPAPCKQDD